MDIVKSGYEQRVSGAFPGITDIGFPIIDASRGATSISAAMGMASTPALSAAVGKRVPRRSG